MRKDFTHLTILLDSSGSMAPRWSETCESIKSFIKDQKKESGKLTISLYTFDMKTRKVLDFVDASHIGEIKFPTCSGWTALDDCFCLSMDKLGSQLSDLPEHDRPSKVLFLLFTDGAENSSTKYKKSDVKERVQRQSRQYSWQFLYLGADYNCEELARETGLSEDYVFNFDKIRTKHATELVSNSVKKFRGMSGAVYDSSLLDEVKCAYNK